MLELKVLAAWLTIKMIQRLLKRLILIFTIGSFGVLFGLIYLYHQLPSVDILRDLRFQVPMRIYSADGELIAEFGEKRRTPVAINEVPPFVKQAFVSIEDRRFYQHYGVDLRGLTRAAVHLITDGQKSQGGSTITMQVARNFFLSRKKTYSRKVNEILLAIKIEHELSKDEILELYLNKVFLGHRAYGIAAAAQVYYGKALEDLTLAEGAMIAGLPKAPSAINPLSNRKAALNRRRQVLESMLDNQHITQAQYETALNAPISASYHGTTIDLSAPYVAEMVRQELVNLIGDSAYTDGLQVYTTINSKLQRNAEKVLQDGLLNYDMRHGLRKPKNISDYSQWLSTLAKEPTFADLKPAIVSQVAEKSIEVVVKTGDTIHIDWPGLSWARKDLGNLRVSNEPKTATDIVKVGDLVSIRLEKNQWRLSQVPEVEGALVSMNPQDGAILALEGGFDYKLSKFNRVTQAELQPGSVFKPFVYSAALAHGFTPASIINDAPIVFNDLSDESLWRPQNDNRTFAGPTSFRTGLIRSRNLVSIRILKSIGIDNAVDYIKQLGFREDNMPKGLSLALGTASVTPLEVVRGYSIIANGGHLVMPHFIERIEDSSGEVVYKSDPAMVCYDETDACPETTAESIMDPRDAYLMTNLLQDAIKRGTGRGAKRIGRTDIAGKTGTTNDQYDAWFSGFTPNVATTVWVGFDNPRSLGEYAAKAALPVWTDYMDEALRDKPIKILPAPPGIVTVKIDPETGLLARSGQENAIFEYFKEEHSPKKQVQTNIVTGNEFNSDLGKPALPEQIF